MGFAKVTLVGWETSTVIAPTHWPAQGMNNPSIVGQRSPDPVTSYQRVKP